MALTDDQREDHIDVLMAHGEAIVCHMLAAEGVALTDDQVGELINPLRSGLREALDDIAGTIATMRAK